MPVRPAAPLMRLGGIYTSSTHIRAHRYDAASVRGKLLECHKSQLGIGAAAYILMASIRKLFFDTFGYRKNGNRIPFLRPAKEFRYATE